MKKAEYLVVDTSAFIRNAQLHDLSDNIITLDEVVKEVTSKPQLKRLVVLPYDLKIKDVFSENIKVVSDFAKKTGDYPCLSATDLKVLALTYQLEKEHVGTDHLRTAPVQQKSVDSYANCKNSPNEQVAGFWSKSSSRKDQKDVDLSQAVEDEEESEEGSGCETSESEGESLEVIEEKNEGSGDSASEEFFSPDEVSTSDLVHDSKDDEAYDSALDECADEKLIEQFDNLNVDESILRRIDHDDSTDVSDNDSIYDDDDCGWITPSNVAQAKKGAAPGVLEDKPVKVACLTTDFAMQNVLKQMGMNIMTIDGMIIKEVRTYILRCHACFKTTSIMDKVFCPKCGLKTLKRVAVYVDDEGKQQIFINFKKPLTARGKRFPLPRFKGGKHSNNPIIVEDQRVPQQKLKKKALQKNNPLDPDYVAGYSPFVMRDTQSRSTMLGFHTRSTMKQLSGNPNQKRKPRRKK